MTVGPSTRGPWVSRAASPTIGLGPGSTAGGLATRRRTAPAAPYPPRPPPQPAPEPPRPPPAPPRDAPPRRRGPPPPRLRRHRPVAALAQRPRRAAHLLLDRGHRRPRGARPHDGPPRTAGRKRASD